MFFLAEQRKKGDNEIISIPEVIKEVFDLIFVNYGDKCYSHPKHYTENPVLNALFNNLPLEKEKKDRTADDVFYEYLTYAKDQTNRAYLSLVIRFVLLFRECFNLSKSKTVVENENKEEKKEEEKIKQFEEFSAKNSAETLPDLCNEFYTDFMEGNNFFGIEDEKDKAEIIELIQHFCIWLFKNEYTKSKLSLAQ